MKDCLVQSPILSHPDWERTFILQTDASGFTLGAVLAQRDEDGREHVINYLSRKLTESETRWDTREKELLAAVWLCEVLHPYLVGHRFTVQTDHANLKWLLDGRHKTRQVD